MVSYMWEPTVFEIVLINHISKKCELFPSFKAVPLHAPITWNTFQFKQTNMTKVACFHGQHFSCLDGI